MVIDKRKYKVFGDLTAEERHATATEARAELMKAAPALVRHRACQALGLDSDINPGRCNQDAQQAMWDALVPMMHKAGDLVHMNAQSTKDVTAALAAGKITVQEAIQLINLVKVSADIANETAVVESLRILAEEQTGQRIGDVING